MPIYRLLQNLPMGPEEIARLTTAYEETLRTIGLVDRNDPITELIARKIIEIGQSGVRDPMLLSELTIKEMGISQGRLRKPKSARPWLQRSPAYRAPSDHTANSLRTAAAEFPTLSMVTRFSGFLAGTEEETHLSRCRSYDGVGVPRAVRPVRYFGRARSKRLASCFLNGTRLSLTGYFCRKGGSHAAPSSETHNLFG
jgi:hypothetical protein